MKYTDTHDKIERGEVIYSSKPCKTANKIMFTTFFCIWIIWTLITVYIIYFKINAFDVGFSQPINTILIYIGTSLISFATMQKYHCKRVNIYSNGISAPFLHLYGTPKSKFIAFTDISYFSLTKFDNCIIFLNDPEFTT